MLSANFDPFAGRDMSLGMSDIDQQRSLLPLLPLALICPECEAYFGVMSGISALGGAGAEAAGLEAEAAAMAASATGSAAAAAEIAKLSSLAEQAYVEDGQLADIAAKLAEEPPPCLPGGFASGTQVLTADGGSKSIQDVKVGDRLAGADAGGGQLQQHVISAVHVTDSDADLADFSIGTASGPHVITASARHSFWDASSHVWTNSADLKPGEQLGSVDTGRVSMISTGPHAGASRTYSLAGSGLNTFYVMAGTVPMLARSALCPVGIGDGIFQYPDNSIRTADGKFAGTVGSNVGAVAEQMTWDQLETKGLKIVRGRIYVTGNYEQLRVYDGLVDLGNGTYLGIEVKSGNASLTAAQRAFDNWVDSGHAAAGVGQALGFKIVGTLPVVFG
jgi:hypothetical protein